MKLILIVDRFDNRSNTPALADSLAQAAHNDQIETSIWDAYRSFGDTSDKIHRKITGYYALSTKFKRRLREVTGNLLFFFKPNYLGIDDIVKLQKKGNKCIWYSGDNPRYPWNITNKNVQALGRFDERFTVNIPNYYQFFEEKDLSYFTLDKSALDELTHLEDLGGKVKDLCFVGTATQLRHDYFYQLSNKLEIGTHIYGNGWKPDKLGAAKTYPSVKREDLSKIFRKYKYNLNLFRLENVDTQNTRLYELLLSRAFIITQKNNFTTKLFGNARFLLDDISPKSVFDLIQFYERDVEQYEYDYHKIYANKDINKFKYSSTAKIIIENLKVKYDL